MDQERTDDQRPGAATVRVSRVWRSGARPRWQDVKITAVLSLLRGKRLETISRGLGVTAATLSGWRDVFPAPRRGRADDDAQHGRGTGKRSVEGEPRYGLDRT